MSTERRCGTCKHYREMGRYDRVYSHDKHDFVDGDEGYGRCEFPVPKWLESCLGTSMSTTEHQNPDCMTWEEPK